MKLKLKTLSIIIINVTFDQLCASVLNTILDIRCYYSYVIYRTLNADLIWFVCPQREVITGHTFVTLDDAWNFGAKFNF